MNLKWILLALLACVPSGFARASQASRASTESISLAASCPWPKELSRGYAPVFVEVWNDSERALTAEVQAVADTHGRDTTTHAARAVVRLGPNERRRIELLVPSDRRVQGSLRVSAKSGGSSTSIGLDTGNAVVDHEVRLMAWVTPVPLGAGVAASYSAKLAHWDPNEKRFVPTSTYYGSYGGGYGMHVAATASSTGAGVKPTWSVFEVGPESMPSRAAAWSAIDVVLLDARAGAASLSGMKLDPLRSHLRQGGLVAILGERAAVTALIGDETVLEERDVMVDAGFSGGAWRVGLGRLAWIPSLDEATTSENFLARDGVALAQFAGEAHETYTKEGALQFCTGAERSRTAAVHIPGFGGLPVRVFISLLLVFGILIGPLNLFVLKRLGRPGLLLASVPAISAVTCALILVFGFLHQGLATAGAVQSFTWLDQSRGRAVTHACYALAPVFTTGALQPERGTTVNADLPDDDFNRELTVEHGDGLRLTGNWLPVRLESRLLVSSDAPARGRIEFRRVGDGIEVTNGLDTTVEELRFLDRSGGSYSLSPASRLSPGASAQLAKGELSSRVPPNVVARVRDTPGSYIATVSRNPFLDDLGLEPKLRLQRHTIQGLVPLDEAEWTK